MESRQTPQPAELSAVDQASPILDRIAIGLSVLCTAHCLALPFLLAIAPAAALLPFANESFHKILVLLAVPTSAVALYAGYREHRHWPIAAQGLFGLVLLVVAAVVGHDLFGETGETLGTVAGAVLIAVSHARNFVRCRASRCDDPNCD